ncbi:hypothetical protein M427DRAFT_145786 [Gonapodya prolifera JEL478]|uniref:Xylanolytic transcriptional activator regulatory domain-containing protein n=1 Tax=Gonapodya prolifera (strain JEL478) TaxID=1344416 RepID=A0A139ADZ4_GONPJ|nr:hypothetical protein M427DRAFT_145786 [Gonapodya prolifera JEL478]|eukprot:KXS15046.1 hypothetical protein M427DRAFT_145786 [Gonapodya prolifera JEL478]
MEYATLIGRWYRRWPSSSYEIEPDLTGSRINPPSTPVHAMPETSIDVGPVASSVNHLVEAEASSTRRVKPRKVPRFTKDRIARLESFLFGTPLEPPSKAPQSAGNQAASRHVSSSDASTFPDGTPRKRRRVVHADRCAHCGKSSGDAHDGGVVHLPRFQDVTETAMHPDIRLDIPSPKALIAPCASPTPEPADALYRIPRLLTIFDDLPPLPSTDLCNELITLYFLSIPPTFSFLHRPSFLADPAAHPALYAAVLCFAAAYHRSPEVRRIGRQALYPRLNRLVGDGSSQDAASLQFLQARIHAFVYAINHVMWDRAYLLLTTFPGSVTYLKLDDERTLSSLPWPESESARRTVWATSMLDGGVNVMVGAGTGQLACGDHLGMVRLPAPERWVVMGTLTSRQVVIIMSNHGINSFSIWDSTIPPPQSSLPPPTLDALFAGLEDASIHPTSASAISAMGLSASLLSLLARSSRVHRWCDARDIFAFRPVYSRVGKRAARDVEDIERDLAAWRGIFELRVAVGGMDVPHEIAPLLRASWEGVWSALHGPSTIISILAGHLVHRPRWVAQERLDGTQPDPSADIPPKLFRPGYLRSTLLAWSSSPSFLIAFDHASNAADVLKVTNEDRDFRKQRLRSTLGRVELLGLSHAAIVLIIAAALGKFAGASHHDYDGILERSEIVMCAFGWSDYPTAVSNPSTVELVEWIVNEMNEQQSGMTITDSDISTRR